MKPLPWPYTRNPGSAPSVRLTLVYDDWVEDWILPVDIAQARLLDIPSNTTPPIVRRAKIDFGFVFDDWSY